MKKKIINLTEIKKIITLLKRKNKKIVQCHGVFDFLHLGHLKHFKTAKKYGDILIISVTPDEFIQKGFGRPYFNSEQRLESLASLEIVDFVVLNNSKNSVDIIKRIKPNYYCKGKEYKNFKEDITGEIKNELKAIKSVGGKLIFTNDETHSSSVILNKNSELYNNLQKRFINKIKHNFDQDLFNKKIARLKKLKVLLVGETIIDKYVFCESIGKSGKEPHLVMRNLKEETYLGGIIAIARSMSDFCKKINILSVLGKDKQYERIIRKNLQKNIKLNLLYRERAPTIVKKRYMEHVSKSKILGIYTLNDELLNNSEEKKVISKIKKEIKKSDLVIVSDYGHGFITNKIAKILCRHSKFLALNAQSNASNVGYHSIQKYKNVDCVVMNESELRQELRDRNQKIFPLVKKLVDMINIDHLVITRSSEGAIMYNKKTKKFYNTPAFATKVVDKVGAGDSMLSILALTLKEKFDSDISMFISSLAAAINVEEISNKVPLSKIKLLKYLYHSLK
jgi:rfaE bifunctional protein kinase chain/domain/rfaE bifunctional protein nucleotidyltransferase chain/domain